jgi:hypothetical protein
MQVYRKLTFLREKQEQKLAFEPDGLAEEKDRSIG